MYFFHIFITTFPGTYNRNIHLYNVSSYEHISSLKGHIGVITDIVASPCGGYCFSSSSDKSMKVKIKKRRNKQADCVIDIRLIFPHQNKISADLGRIFFIK